MTLWFIEYLVIENSVVLFFLPQKISKEEFYFFYHTFLFKAYLPVLKLDCLTSIVDGTVSDISRWVVWEFPNHVLGAFHYFFIAIIWWLLITDYLSIKIKLVIQLVADCTTSRCIPWVPHGYLTLNTALVRHSTIANVNVI